MGLMGAEEIATAGALMEDAEESLTGPTEGGPTAEGGTLAGPDGTPVRAVVTLTTAEGRSVGAEGVTTEYTDVVFAAAGATGTLTEPDGALEVTALTATEGVLAEAEGALPDTSDMLTGIAAGDTEG